MNWLTSLLHPSNEDREVRDAGRSEAMEVAREARENIRKSKMYRELLVADEQYARRLRAAGRGKK